MTKKLLRVLIVDDSEDDVLLQVHLLKKNGYDPDYEQVQTAYDMKKALQDKQWDVIICDYQMPEFSGPLAIELLNETKLDIPLIIVSGVINDVMAVECMRLGAKDYVLKNNLSRLCPAIERELEEAENRKLQKLTEEKLHREEKLFRAIAEQSSDIVVIANHEGTIVYENPAVEKILGFKDRERIGKSVLENIHPDDVDLVRTTFKRLINDKDAPVQKTEIRIHHRDGSWRTFESVGSNLILENFVNTVVVNLHDVTENKRADERLRESESRFRAIYNSTSDGILIIQSKSKKFVMANEKICEMLGYSEKEFLKLGLDDIHPKEDLKYVSDQFKKLSDEIISVAPDIPVLRKDKTVFFADVGSSPIEIAGESCLIGLFRDVTQRKKVTEALQRSEANFRMLADNAPDAIFIRSGSNFAYVNSAALKLFGADSPGQLIGHPVMDRIHPGSIEATRERMRILDKLKQPVPIFEQKYLKLDGIVIDVEVSAVPFCYENTDGSLVFIRDITGRKKTEETLLLIKKAVESSRDAIGMADPQGRPFYYNKALTDLVEYTPEEMDEAGGVPAVYCDKKVIGEVLDIIKNGGSWSGETQMISQSGRIYTVLLRADAIKDETGKIIGLMGVNTDITERKKAEESVVLSEEKFRAIFESNSAAIAIINHDTTIAMVNKAYCEISGYTKEEALGLSWTTQIAPYDLERLKEYNRSRMVDPQNTPSLYEFDFYTKNGEIKHVMIYVAVMPGSRQIITAFNDITEKKEQEEKLKNTLMSLRKAFGSIIQVMVSAVEMKDPYTAGHQVRTADLARSIAEEMGLDRDTIDGIRMAGTIHDIGKLSIPAEILSKPTKLTNVEFSLIKGHPESGYEMLKDVESPWPLAQIVYQHHERINGSGYPRNLKGDEILLEARIMAVADVVEAMASHRPYRPALGIQTALDEIEKNRGILYDASVVDACMKLFREKGYNLKPVL